ncbi:MAG: hypothetical protein RXR02_04965 [Thermoproteus sp.]
MPDLELLPDVHDVALLQITIQNPTSYATASPHVQHIAIQDAYLSWLLGVPIDVRKIAFADPQANALAPSWYSLFDGAYHHFFIKTGQIPASSSYTLYLIYSYKRTLLDGKTVGISAWAGLQLFGIPYGQLDNGSSIFLLYDNFAGTSLSSAWTQNLNGGSISVNNGLTMTLPSSASNNLGLVRSVSVPSIGATVYTLFDVLQCCGCSGGNDFAIDLGNSLTIPGGGSANSYEVTHFGCGGNCYPVSKIVNGSRTVFTYVSNSVPCGNYTNVSIFFEWLYTTQSYLYRTISVGVTTSVTDNTFTPSAISQLLLGIYKPGSNTTSYLIHHVAVYDPPPVQPDLPISISPTF